MRHITQMKNYSAPLVHQRRLPAFTLIELLAVVAVIVLVAVSLVPALARARPMSALSVCRNNLRQLGLGASLYLADNADTFPACASRNTYGFQVADWIYWRGNLPAFPLQNSPILLGLGKASTNIFRCPADRENSARIAWNFDGNGTYNASYTITSYGISNARNIQGISSIIDPGGAIYPFKSCDIRRPSGKIVFAEEQSVIQGPECSYPNATILNDGRWMPPFDVLTSRHYSNADVGFGDGHVDTVNWKFGSNPTNSQADL